MTLYEIDQKIIDLIDGKKMTSKQHAQALDILKKIEDGNNRKN